MIDMTQYGRPHRAVSVALAALILAPALAAAPDAAQAQEITWQEKFYNPKPAEDGTDLVLPMPCGGDGFPSSRNGGEFNRRG